MTEIVFSVHTARPAEVGAVEIMYLTERQARVYAKDRSRDFRVLSASVTSFAIGQLGTRTSVAWYVDGVEQDPRGHNPQRYPADADPTRPGGPPAPSRTTLR